MKCMGIFKIVGLGLAAAVLAVFVKGWKPELSITISLVASAIIFLMVAPYLETVMKMFEDISSQVGINGEYMGIALKITGIAYVSQFGAELCRDSGESAIASKIEFGGKIIIMVLSLPVMYNLLGVVSEILNFK